MPQKQKLMLFLVCCMIALIASCNSEDRRITKEVKSRLLSDSVLSSAKIDVSAHNGTVTLEGKVIGQNEADHAIQLTRSVSGVRAVNTHLQIDTHITNKDIRQTVKQGQKAAKEQNQEQQTHP